jgi:hypothetical protein
MDLLLVIHNFGRLFAEYLRVKRHSISRTAWLYSVSERSTTAAF